MHSFFVFFLHHILQLHYMKLQLNFHAYWIILNSKMTSHFNLLVLTGNEDFTLFMFVCLPVAKRWFCKLRQLLGNALNMTGLWNLFLSNGSANTFPRKRDTHNNTVRKETGVFFFFVVRAKKLSWRQLSWLQTMALTKDRPVLSSERAPHRKKA
jgi:hypothetical protein